MDPFPEDWELLALFEVEPVLTDLNVPWSYNKLTFETKREEYLVRCEIEPSYEIIRLSCWQMGRELFSLDLHWVISLRVHTGEGKDYFVAHFRDPNLLPLEFHLKPSVRLLWGTSSDCP